MASEREHELILYFYFNLHLQLGWQYNITYDKTPILDYESERLLKKNYHIRPLNEFYRHQMLLEFGFTYNEIGEVANSAAHSRER